MLSCFCVLTSAGAFLYPQLISDLLVAKSFYQIQIEDRSIAYGQLIKAFKDLLCFDTIVYLLFGFVNNIKLVGSFKTDLLFFFEVSERSVNCYTFHPAFKIPFAFVLIDI